MLTILISQYLIGGTSIGKSFTIKQRLHAAVGEKFRVIAVNENFTSHMFLRSLREIIETGEKKIGLHIDISCYAPYEIINRLLTHLFFGGSVIDETTGEALAIPAGIELHIFFELGLAPSVEDAALEKFKLESAVLDHLPMVSFLAESSEVEKTISLRGASGDAVRTVAKLFCKLRQRAEPIEADLLGLAIEVLRLAKTPLAGVASKVNFFKLLAQRCNLLAKVEVQPGLFAALAFENEAPGEFETQTIGMAPLEADRLPLFHMFVDECAFLCQEQLSLADATENAAHVPLLSFELQGAFGFPDFSTFKFVSFGGSIDRYPKWVKDNTTIVKSDSTSVEELSKHLRKLLSELFNCRSHEIWRILHRHRFVLTGEVFLALLLLKSRMDLRMSLIWEGGTGTLCERPL